MHKMISFCSKTRAILVFAVCSLALYNCNGQDITGSLTGVVKDHYGAAIPSATITLTMSTPVTTTANTDVLGAYSLHTYR